MTMREEQAARSREKLLDTVQQLLKTKNYDSISISDITNASGMSIGNFYHYFKSKEEVFTAMERRPYFQLLFDMDAIKEKSVGEQLRYYIRHWTDLLVNCYGLNICRHWVCYYTGHSADPSARNNKIDIIADEILTCLRHGIDNGELVPDAPVNDIAYSIAFTLFGILGYYCMTDGSFPALEWAEQYCTMLEKSILSACRQDPAAAIPTSED